jgi:hypothetical protein
MTRLIAILHKPKISPQLIVNKYLQHVLMYVFDYRRACFFISVNKLELI